MGSKCKEKIPVKARVGAAKSDVAEVGNAKEGLHRRGLKLILLDNPLRRLYLSNSKYYFGNDRKGGRFVLPMG
jgi:hypothetical protein